MIEYHTIFAFAFTVCLTKRDEQYIKCTGIPLGLIFFSVLYFATIIPVQPTPRKMKFTTVAATFAGLTTLIQAAPAVPVSEEIQTIQHDIKNLNSDFNNLIQSLNLNLNEATQEDLAKGYESDELIAELGRSLLEASRNQNGDVLSILHQVTKRDAVDDDIVGAVDVSKRGGFVTIHDHQISIDAIIKAIEYVIIFNHPLPNSDHFDHVLKILGIDADLAAQVNLTYHTVTIDFVAILTKLIDIGHDVVDIAEKVITVTIAGVVLKIEVLIKAIEYIIIQHHYLPNHDHFLGLLAILGIDIETAHSIGIWETSSTFEVVAIFTKYIGLGVFNDVPNTAE